MGKVGIKVEGESDDEGVCSPLAVNEIPDQVRNDSRGGIVRFPLRGNGVSINR